LRLLLHIFKLCAFWHLNQHSRAPQGL